MRIVTDCAYTRHGLKHIRLKLSKYEPSCDGNIYLFDSRTKSLSDLASIKHPKTWVIVLFSPTNKLNPAFILECKNSISVDISEKIDSLISHCSHAIAEFKKREQLKKKGTVPEYLQRHRKKTRMLHLFAQGFTVNMTAEIMGVNSKTLYAWSGEFIKEHNLRNLTQLRYLSVSLGSERISKALLK